MWASTCELEYQIKSRARAGGERKRADRTLGEQCSSYPSAIGAVAQNVSTWIELAIFGYGKIGVRFLSAPKEEFSGHTKYTIPHPHSNAPAARADVRIAEPDINSSYCTDENSLARFNYLQRRGRQTLLRLAT
jgi:hypothetical protein